MNGARIWWTWVGMQVLERRAHLALSLRVTIAALLAFAVSNMMSLRLPLWTVLTAIILTQASFGRSVKATLDYLAGTLGGAIYAGAVSVLVPHNSELSLAGVLALAVAALGPPRSDQSELRLRSVHRRAGAAGSGAGACRPDRIRG